MNFFKYKNGRISKLTKKLFRRIKNYARKARGYFIFTSRKDKKIFYNLSHGKINGNEVFSLNIKTAGKYPVFLRNNIADAGGACSAFFMHYHLPPKKLRPGAVIADLGSNIGLTMRNLKYLYPDSRIIGVEMDHENYLLAKKNLNGLDNCVLI